MKKGHAKEEYATDRRQEKKPFQDSRKNTGQEAAKKKKKKGKEMGARSRNCRCAINNDAKAGK